MLETPLVNPFSMELDYFYMKLRVSPRSTIELYDLIKKNENERGMNVFYKTVFYTRNSKVDSVRSQCG